MSDFFKDLFRKKTERSMQERAEKSRRDKETDELDSQFDETTSNLYSLLDELHKKKTGNGD